MAVAAKALQSCLTLCAPWTVAHQAPLSMGFSRQGCWNGLPCPSPGDLPNPVTEPTCLTSPALTGGFFTTSATWEAHPQCHTGLFFRAGHGGAPTLRLHTISQVWTKCSPSPSAQMEMGQCFKKQVEGSGDKNSVTIHYKRIYNTLKWQVEQKTLSFLMNPSPHGQNKKINHIQVWRIKRFFSGSFPTLNIL